MTTILHFGKSQRKDSQNKPSIVIKLWNTTAVELNPLSAKSDQHLISPFNIMAKSNIKVKKRYGQLQKDVILFSFLDKKRQYG